MKSEPHSGLQPKRETRPGVGLASTVDAALRSQVVTLATELQRQDELAQAAPTTDDGLSCDAIKKRLDQKRQELQEHLSTADELKQRLKVLKAITPPEPNELRVRVLLMHGSIYDFTRLGKASHRERLDHALHQATQKLETHWDIHVVFGQPQVVEKGANTAWEITLDELWRLGDLYASEGTPALLFADRILLPDKTLPHSWGCSDRSIACIGDSEWLSEGEGQITAHNLVHLLGLDDNKRTQGLMSHQEMDLELSQGEIERLKERAAERAAAWVEEHATACQRGEEALSLAQHTVVLLERQGDQLWHAYQACMEKTKDTPTYGVSPVDGVPQPSPAWSDLAREVEQLSQRLARAEQELMAAKEMLGKVQSRLRELGSKEFGNGAQDGR